MSCRVVSTAPAHAGRWRRPRACSRGGAARQARRRGGRRPRRRRQVRQAASDLRGRAGQHRAGVSWIRPWGMREGLRHTAAHSRARDCDTLQHTQARDCGTPPRRRASSHTWRDGRRTTTGTQSSKTKRQRGDYADYYPAASRCTRGLGCTCRLLARTLRGRSTSGWSARRSSRSR